MTPASSKRSGGAACSPSCAPPAARHELVRIHRFTHPWEAAASLQLRAGDPDAIDLYESHGRIQPGTLDEHLAGIAHDWLTLTAAGRTVAVTASSNQHVDALNNTIQHARLDAGQLDPATAVAIAGGERAHVGEIVVTRRNDRRLTTSIGETVRNRDHWTVTATHPDGRAHRRAARRPRDRHPAGRVRRPSMSGSATPPPSTATRATPSTSASPSPPPPPPIAGSTSPPPEDGDENRIHVITDTDDLAEARDVLDGVLAHDRADIPAVTQRRHLANAEAQPARPQPEPLVPDWVRPWRQQIDDRRQFLVDDLADREHRRASQRARSSRRSSRPSTRPERRGSPTPDPSVTSSGSSTASCARPCGAPTTTPVRPGSGIGAHPTTRCRRRAAVEQAEAAIAAIHADGAPVKQHLDRLQTRAAELRGRTEPSRRLDHLDRNRSAELDQILDAADTYTDWLEGRPTPTARLAHAVEHPAQVASTLPRSPSTQTPSTRPSGTSSSTSHPTTSNTESYNGGR